MFRINMIFAIGAVSLFRSGLHDTTPMDYYAAAMQHADHMFKLAGIEQVQALLLVLLFSLQHDVGSESPLSRECLCRRCFIANYVPSWE